MKKMRGFALVIALAAIVFSFLSQETLAYYTLIGRATSVVTSGDVQLAIHERQEDGSAFPEEGVYVTPGDVVSKEVTIENVCGHPFYLRVKLVSGIDSDELSVEDAFKIDLNEEDWTQHEDGYIYYNVALQPGEITTPLFTEVEIVGEYVDQVFLGKTMTLTVAAHAVQSENNPAHHPWEASGWPAE